MQPTPEKKSEIALSVSPDALGRIRSIQQQRETTRQLIFREMAGIADINPPHAALVTSGPSEPVGSPADDDHIERVMTDYLKNTLIEHITRELAVSGSASSGYTLQKENVADVVHRLPHWAEHMGFPQRIVSRLHAADLFEEVWSDLQQDLTGDTPDTAAA